MTSTTLSCTCGKVQLEVAGAPFVAAECYCTSCRSAAAVLEALPGAPAVRNRLDGTPYALYRKDRVRFAKGRDLLREYRLTPESPSRRVVASCCNTPVFLEFKGGHWLSLYAALWPAGTAPEMQVRTMTSDLPADVRLDADLPNARHQSFGFIAAMLGAWIAMGFRVPTLDFAKEPLKVT